MCVCWPEQNGLTALHLASKEGHIGVIDELVRRGASVDASTKVRCEPACAVAVTIVTSPPVGVRSIAMSMSVCLSVCLFARISKSIYVQTSRSCLYVLAVAVV